MELKVPRQAIAGDASDPSARFLIAAINGYAK
jgi:hypothetical protein